MAVRQFSATAGERKGSDTGPDACECAGGGGVDARPVAPAGSAANEQAAQRSACAEDTDRQLIAVCGAHMSGLPLNAELVTLGGVLVTAARTTADYRLFALDWFDPPRPGLLRVGTRQGAAIDIEIWALPIEQVGRFLRGVAAPLCIGHVALAGGGSVHGFLCEACATAQARDISEFGGWRQFLSAAA